MIDIKKSVNMPMMISTKDINGTGTGYRANAYDLFTVLPN